MRGVPDQDDRKFPMPAHQRLLVKPLDSDEVHEPEYVAGVQAHKPDRGIVTHVGPGYRLGNGSYAPLDYLPGDEVYFYKQQAVPVRIGEETLLLVRDENVLVVLDGGILQPDGV